MSSSSAAGASQAGHKTFQVGDYVIGSEIGKGSFATVYKCYHTVRFPRFFEISFLTHLY